MTIKATLRRDWPGPTGITHPAGESVTMVNSQLFQDIILEDGEELRIPVEDLRRECEVPACTQEAEYIAPGIWCKKHWKEWSDLEREEPGPGWMQDDREQPETVTTIRNPMALGDRDIKAGTLVQEKEEHLMIYAEVQGEDILFQFHRQVLNIECEVPGCEAEADTWHPRYWCKEHWRIWLECRGSLPDWADIHKGESSDEKCD